MLEPVLVEPAIDVDQILGSEVGVRTPILAGTASDRFIVPSPSSIEARIGDAILFIEDPLLLLRVGTSRGKAPRSLKGKLNKNWIYY